MKRLAIPLLALLGAGAMVPCGAANIVTVDPVDHAVGADITNAYPGVILQRIRNTPGTIVYTPIYSPALVGDCAGYGPCPEFDPLKTVAGAMANGNTAVGCYNVTRLGGTTSQCGQTWSMLELTFPNGTDYVQVESIWTADPPAIFAYDAAGNQIVSCLPAGSSNSGPAPGSPANCLVSQIFSPGGDVRGVINVQAGSPVIRRVVVGSYAGASRSVGIQYNLVRRQLPCLVLKE
jgi:hypothetical protein